MNLNDFFHIPTISNYLKPKWCNKKIITLKTYC